MLKQLQSPITLVLFGPKDEDNNRWLNDAGTMADPAHVEQLEKRALTQYQARQMGA